MLIYVVVVTSGPYVFQAFTVMQTVVVVLVFVALESSLFLITLFVLVAGTHKK